MKTHEQTRHQYPGNISQMLGASGAADFRSFLQARTKVPTPQLADILSADSAALSTELGSITRILRRFARTVADASQSADAVQTFLQELDLKLISRDHDWRAIFSTVRSQRNWSPSHKLMAVEHYLGYLSFRRRLIAYVLERHAALADTGAMKIQDLIAESQLDGRDPKTDRNDPLGHLYRMPEGEPVLLEVPGSRSIPVWLAEFRFTLACTQPRCLVTDRGETINLNRDRNLVGRHTTADVVIPERYHSVSRAHLMIEWVGQNVIKLTDLSSQGSFIKRSATRLAQGSA